MSDKIRTRFAPSPTGNLHVGGARTALFNWLYSRHTGGDFVLRIEDTDFDRSADRFTEQILSAMKWLGLEWDEGPEVGGGFGPYHQSDRIERYMEVVDQLKAEGVAYRCFCTREELEKERERQKARREPTRYSGRCRSLSDEQIQENLDEGLEHTWRYQIPNKPEVVHDVVKGDVSFPADQVGDFIIVKSNGTPSYNFAVVVDDHDMEISHVIRGDDHLSNTPRQLYIYDALGWEPPTWCHLPMILGEDGSRLSKRHGATDVEDYRRDGFLPEAMLNALALLGWSPPDGKEIKTPDELTEVFELERVNTSASRFDFDKVRWLNGQHLRDMPAEEMIKRLQPFMPGAMEPEDVNSLDEIVDVLREQLELLADFSPLYDQYFKEPIEPGEDAIDWLADDEERIEVVRQLRDEVEKVDQLDKEATKQTISQTDDVVSASGKGLYLPMRVGITGQLEGPEFHLLMPILGRDRCLSRLNVVLDAVSETTNV